MMAYLKQEENKEFIFLTLTAPNVPAEELEDEIKDYNHSFKKLMERKEIKKIVKGYARKLEITYNEERDDYHPHFHVLIAVNKVILHKQLNISLGIGGWSCGSKSQKIL